ncbi:unnamed protein product [Caenorhabditis sp. 36 PRJEB53466]|nr:unnamed protein product [Caenorhabditis sp. 36 PRJEB53466]
MALKHYTAQGYEAFQEVLQSIGKGQRVVALFTGSKNLSTGLSWCPDCVVAEPVVESVLADPAVASQDVHFVTVFVGNREVWRDPAVGFRTDPKLKLTCIPTLLEVGNKAKRLLEAQMNDEIYHEKQRLQYCLIHTVNNILQRNEFDAAKMNEICYSFDDSRWFNPHKSWIGTGNYDANILMAALQMHDLKVMWFDKRAPIERIHVDRVKAFVFNTPSRTLLTLYRGRHWFAVIRKNERFYNVDSKLNAPEPIDDIRKFLEEHGHAKDTEMMLVVENAVEEGSVVEK